MSKIQKDPVKDFQKQCVDQRVCLFYVADRIRNILAKNQTEEHFKNEIQDFENELVHNIGVNALIERYEY